MQGRPCKFLMKPFDPRPPAAVRELEPPSGGLGKGLDDVSKLRQIADLRTGITSGKPILAKLSPSAPNLHDFSTKTHLARLDISHEKLDSFVEQKVEELRSAILQKSQDLENLLNRKVGAVEEQLATVRDSLSKDHSSAEGEEQDVLRKRVESLEERLSLSSSAQGGKNDVSSEIASELLSRIGMLEQRLQPDSHTVSEVGEEVKLVPEVGEEVNLVSEVGEEVKLVAEVGEDVKLDLEIGEEVRPVSEAGEEVKPMSERDIIESGEDNVQALYAEAQDVGPSSQKPANICISQSVQNRICGARAESLRAAVSELAGQQEALRIEKTSLADKQVKETAVLGSLEDRFIALQKQLETIAREVLNSSMEAENFKAKCIKAQVLLEGKITSTESKVTMHQEECTKLFESLFFRPRQEMALKVQGIDKRQAAVEATICDLSSVVDRCKAIESQLEDFSRSFVDMHEQADGLNRSGSQSQPQGEQIHATSVPLLWIGKCLAEMRSGSRNLVSQPCEDTSVRLMALEEEVRNTGDAVTQVEQQLSSAPSQKDLQSLRARIEGGLRAVLTRLEAHHYVKEQEDAASDRVFRTFSMKTDERIGIIESHINKNDNILDRVIEKSHLKVKTIAVPVKCPECGTFNGREVVNCTGCGVQRTHELVKTKADKHKRTKAVLIWQKEKLDKKVIEYNDKLLSVIFDVWARGEKAHCLTSFRTKRMSQSPRQDFSPRRNSLAPPAPNGMARTGTLQSSPESLGKTMLSRSSRSESPQSSQLGVPQKRNWLLSLKR